MFWTKCDGQMARGRQATQRGDHYYIPLRLQRGDNEIKRMSLRTIKPTTRLVRPAKTDQPAHPRSLIRVFADRMCLLQSPDCSKRDKREPLSYWVDVQADMSLCWLRISYCRFCRTLAQIKGCSFIYLNAVIAVPDRIHQTNSKI